MAQLSGNQPGSFVVNKLFAFINVFGLAVGLCSVILIALYVADELSYDRFHPDADRIYRISRDFYPVNGATERRLAANAAAAAAVLKTDFPEIEEVARVLPGSPSVARDELVFLEPGMHYVDPELIRIFPFEWVQGDPDTALLKVNSVVITESIARKYFGDEDPFGQTLNIVNHDLKVTGVIRDTPANSHMGPMMFALRDRYPVDLAIFPTSDVRQSDRMACRAVGHDQLAAAFCVPDRNVAAAATLRCGTYGRADDCVAGNTLRVASISPVKSLRVYE